MRVRTCVNRTVSRTREIERICEISVLGNVAGVFQNTNPMFASRIKQSADAAEGARMRLMNALRVVNERIGSHPFVAGQHPSIADCTLLAALDFATFAGIEMPTGCNNIARWSVAFHQRPSASA